MLIDTSRRANLLIFPTISSISSVRKLPGVSTMWSGGSHLRICHLRQDVPYELHGIPAEAGPDNNVGYVEGRCCASNDYLNFFVDKSSSLQKKIQNAFTRT